MPKEHIVEIPTGSGNKYRYEYVDGDTKYRGPVGDAPVLSEVEFHRTRVEYIISALDDDTYSVWTVGFDPDSPPDKILEHGSYLNKTKAINAARKHAKRYGHQAKIIKDGWQ